MNTIKIGSTVKYSVEWLRNTGQYSGNICFAKGVVAGLEVMGTITLATINWNRLSEFPAKVNVENLVLLRDPETAEY